jgi:hypothetical protein
LRGWIKLFTITWLLMITTFCRCHVAGLTDQFERVLYRLALRAVKRLIQDDWADHLDSKVGAYVDAYVRSPVIRQDLEQAVYGFCRDDSDFVTQVREIVREVIDNEVKEVTSARLREVKIGDLSFTNWLVRVALKEVLDSDAIRQTIEAGVKTQVEAILKRMLLNGLMASPEPKTGMPQQ